MPLTFNAGEAKTFQLQADGYKVYNRHWVGREYKPCSGPGCGLCAAGVAPRQDYMIPIAIGGVGDSWVFSSAIAQQLDSFTQQGHKLLGLMVKVSRTGSGRDTRYQVSIPGAPSPPVTPAPTLTSTPTSTTVYQPQPRALVISEISKLRASDWGKLMQRLLTRADFLDIIASELQAMHDEGLWK